MDTLAREVLTYYFTHAAELPREKQFHLANRLHTWNKDGRATTLLAACKEWYVPGPATNAALAERLAEAAERATAGLHHIVAYELRQPFFGRYPSLAGLEAELFLVRHLQDLFSIDASAAFAARHPNSELQELETALLADHEALLALSTWAINFIYLYRRCILHDENGIDVGMLYELGKQYNVQDVEQLRLCVYFYTHCIIADSNFYARALPEANLPVYQKMLARLEELLAPRLSETSLDTKLEFLVCCRLANYQTHLENSIYGECAQSVSPEGTFLVDTHNVFAENDAKKTLEASEHRNVLFAMGVLPRR